MTNYELSLGAVTTLRALYDSRNTSCALRTVYGFAVDYHRRFVPRLNDETIKGRI